MKADMLGFLAPPGGAPNADPTLLKPVDLMHVTAVPSELHPSQEVLNGNNTPIGLDSLRKYIEENSNLKLVRTSDDIQDHQEDDPTGIIIGLQDVPSDINLDMLLEFYEYGVRVIKPPHQEANHTSGGANTKSSKTLSEQEKQFLLNCSEAGLILDLSYLGHQTARNILDYRVVKDLDLPVMVSHTGKYKLTLGKERHNPNELGNLPWQILKRIAAAGGIIGLSGLMPDGSKDTNNAKPNTPLIKSAISELGRSAVAISTNSTYAKQVKEKQEGTPSFDQLLANTRSGAITRPARRPEPKMLRMLSLIELELFGEGVDDAVIDLVIGKNALNFFTRNLRSGNF